MKTFVLLALLFVWLVVTPTACVDRPTAARLLTASGYTTVRVGDYAWFSCGDDAYATHFRGTSPGGQAVSGVVCCGLLKSCTVRLDP